MTETGPVHILVVDDEPGIREGCSRILAAEGYSVSVAADGVEALEQFRRNGFFSVALVDLKMPRMGGLDLIKHLREMDQDVVIFVITAYAAIDTAVEATRLGAYGYIPKPFTPDELLVPLRQGLERRALNIETRRLREEREHRLLELASERSKSSTIISCMTDGVIVINRDKQIVLRNTAAMRIIPAFGVMHLPTPLDQLGLPDLTDLVEQALAAVTGPQIASREISIDRSTFMANVSPVLEPSAEISGAVAVLRDITALKKLETAKSMFISMVAHEIKSPLAAIESQLTAVLSGAVGDPDREKAMLERALLRARTLRNVVNDLLNLTAMETGNFTITRAMIDLREVLSTAVDSFREKADEKQITITVEYEPTLGDGKVFADKESMLLVFSNLLDNAVKYTLPQGHIRITAGRDSVYTRISFQDTGIGMTREEQEDVFDEFYRAKNDYTVHVPGTGLGLTIVQRLLELHHGRILVQSEPNKGSTFTVCLPSS